MKNFLFYFLLALSFSSNLYAQDSWEGVDGHMIFPKDTITTTIIIEGDSDIDIIKVAIQDPEMIHMFNFYQDILWSSSITFDGPAIVNKLSVVNH